ncbi:MAG: primase C-terminal domain-containing protein [Thermus sp.]|uniref:replication initiation protein n=1 Tax=Thermus sp. TaxID=275 RepID=UPI0025DDC828|nr:replication initiation protein [Thermus sp.]MCS7219527.1 primase C-terminal domain-containing protein [Thermus sp.]
MNPTNSTLELFLQRLPRRPYATEDLSRGLRIHRRQTALRLRYIQVGGYPHALPRLVLDVDHTGWVDSLEDLRPSLVVVNPQSHHAHVWYEFADPFPPEPSQRSLELLADLSARLEAYHRADPSYGGLMGRNPLRVPVGYAIDGPPWDPVRLAEALRLRVPRVPEASLRASAYGRNKTLFDALRHWAYGQVEGARRSMDEARWREVVLRKALSLNERLFQDHPKGPLPANEVRWTAKSVAKWTWRRYRGGRIYITPSTGNPDRSRMSRALREAIPPLSPQARQEAHRRGGATRGQARREEAEAKLVEALRRLQARGERVTASALAREAGVHRHTARRWLARMRR